MKKITTQDGSITFYSQQYEQTYHSTSGAVEEATKKFVEPAKVREKALTGKIEILDVCFGLGYKSLMAIHLAKQANQNCKISITALEKDSTVLNTKVKVFQELEQDYTVLRQLVKQSLKTNASAKKDNVSVNVVLGDATQTIKMIRDSFGVVFLDPFSPKKNPELWTLDFFKDVYRLMRQDAILATYSCASSVRRNLKEAGFTVKDGPCVGRKSPSTVALRQAL